MKVSLLTKTTNNTTLLCRYPMLWSFLFILGFGLKLTPALAEGSKDLTLADPTGFRLFLDTDPAPDRRQQFKVYAADGEFINVGASHVGLGNDNQKGRIRVISPDGNTTFTFDGTGNAGIILNRAQELAGPFSGYIPGTVPVPANMGGVWTVIFDYENNYYYPFGGFDGFNILNNFSWNRAQHQPVDKTFILAWDITVSSDAVGNSGTTFYEGRAYSNEYIGVVSGNGEPRKTSPTFYVLTDDGFIYRTEIKDIDPYRFPLSSNSFGLVDRDGVPIYKSKSRNPAEYLRSADTSSWDTSPFSFFLYEPQAQDLGALINNKIFFNYPDTASLPSTATVLDFYHDTAPHTTWLWGGIDAFDLTSQSFVGFSQDSIPCSAGVIEYEKGGFFFFGTNLGGSITLYLDLNNNHIYDDSVDVELNGTLTDSLGFIDWDGRDGFGNPIAVQDSFTFNYTGEIRYGEIHIALTDVEEIKPTGGVKFFWENNPDNPGNAVQFYYDHLDIIDSSLPAILPTPVSGYDPAGPFDAPIATDMPYYYDSVDQPSGDNESNGNDNYLDQWSFFEFQIAETPVVVNVVLNCVCDTLVPVLTTSDGNVCEGDTLTLTAMNTVPGVGDLDYVLTGPNGDTLTSVQVGEMETFSYEVTPSATSSDAGNYTITATTTGGCSDSEGISVTVNPNPGITSIVGGGSYCSGDDVILITANINAGLTTITNYVWTGPGNFSQSDSVVGTADIILTLNDVSVADGGTYAITMTSDLGCVGGPFTANVTVNPTPVLVTDDPTVSVCADGTTQLVAENTTPGINTMTCTWTLPNGNEVVATVGGDDDIVLDLPHDMQAMQGTYTLVCSVGNCESAPLQFVVTVQTIPVISAISPTGDFCVGDDVTLTAQHTAPVTAQDITFVWVGPGNDTLTVDTIFNALPGVSVYEYTLENIQLSQAGNYTLTLYTSAGCPSAAQSVEIGILPTPVICNITGDGDACVGQDVVLSAFNCADDVLPITYTWRGPNGNILATNSSNNDGPYELSLLNVQLNNSGTYCLTLETDAPVCETEVCVELNVSEGLNVLLATPDTACVGETIVLTGTSSLLMGTITYTWTGPNGVVCTATVPATDPLTCTIPNAEASDAGQYVLVATSDQDCSFGPESVEVVIFPDAEILTVEGGGTICDADTLFLNGTGTGTAAAVDYEWLSPSGEIVGTGNTPPTGPFPGQDHTPEAGVYTLTITTADGCTDTETVTVEVGCTPIAEILFADTMLCELDTLTICGQNLNGDCGFIQYTWLTPNGVTVEGSANGTEVFCDEIMPLATYGSGYYYLYITSNGCTSLADSVLVELKPNPIISQIMYDPVCEGDTAKVYFYQMNPAVDSFFYTCNLPGGISVTDTAATSDTICIFITEPGFVFCSIESFDRCVSSLAGTEVIFNSGFDLIVSPDTAVCEGEPLMLTGSNTLLPCTGDAVYTWTDPNGTIVFTGTAPCEGPFPVSLSDPISGDYCLVVSSATGTCPDTACVNVEVLPAPFVVGGEISGGGDYCETSSATLTATVEKEGGGDIDYEWIFNGTVVASGTVPSGTEVTLPLTNLGLDDSGEYCLELTCSATGCPSNEPQACTTVTVSPSPIIDEIEGAGTYCEGVDVMLDASGPTGPGDVTYTWEGPNFTFTGTAPCGGPYPATVGNIQQNQAGVYTLTLQKDSCVEEASIVIEVNPTPDITISIDGPVCVGQETTLTVTIDPDGANFVDWDLTGPNGFSEMGTVFSDTTIVFTITVGSGDTYTLSATSDQGCEADPVQDTADPLQIPPPTLTASPNPLCAGEVLQLTTQAQQGTEVSYCWFRDGVLLGITDDPIFNGMEPVSGNYTVQAKVDGCDETSSPVSVTVTAPPTANDDQVSGAANLPIGGNVLTNDVPSTGVTITVTSGPSNGTVTVAPDGSFVYTPNTGFVGPQDQFSYQICLIDCPELCDEATVTILIIVDECEVPNIITPNGDNVNDELFIDCVPSNPNNEIRVFNRWGDEIYSAAPYDNTWGGTYKGDPVPAGTYFYLFYPDKDRKEEHLAGYIKVVR